MLPLVLVALLAQSAFGAPTASITQIPINNISPLPNLTGRLVSSSMTDGALAIVDGGETNIYILTLGQIFNDLANEPDTKSQALVMGQLLAVLGQLSYGVPVSACNASNVIDAFVSGNRAAIASAVSAFVGDLITYVDYVSALAQDSLALRFSSGPANTCNSNGRLYQFEAAWDAILSNQSPYTVSLVNEEYCAARRLWGAADLRSNLVGTALTAASLPPVVSVIENALEPVAIFLNDVSAGANTAQSAANAKSALAYGLSCLQV